MSMQLFSHNQTAYDSALAMPESFGKAAIVHPTGTGKSFIAFKLCEDKSVPRRASLLPRTRSFGYTG